MTREKGKKTDNGKGFKQQIKQSQEALKLAKKLIEVLEKKYKH